MRTDPAKRAPSEGGRDGLVLEIASSNDMFIYRDTASSVVKVVIVRGGGSEACRAECKDCSMNVD